ncbi:MAG: hypothetical protein HYR88_00845 [Verrucomicrobia bacterium]|nr:hypothetical protein [Verrucomicrobiota bacterium]MBI3870313.1 hypothetical protein [Verrucomicrobiota bacterium]
MFTSRIPFTTALSLLCVSAIVSTAAESPELSKLQGLWNAKAVSSSGQEVHHALEIKGDKMTFKLMNANHELRLVAKGSVKTERLGPFNVLQLSDLQAGRSEDQTEAVNDDRSSIYTLEDENLILVSNLDKQRDGQKPNLTIYTRALAAKEPATLTDKVVGKWKMKVKLNDNERDYDLSLAVTDGKLGGAVTSARSGEHKLKAASFADGKLSIELVREIGGVEATILYSGELKDDKLSGAFSVKGFEDQYKGTWTAEK